MCTRRWGPSVNRARSITEPRPLDANRNTFIARGD
jgi:hypothetical protein